MLINLAMKVISKVVAIWTAVTSPVQGIQIESLLKADLYVKWKVPIDQGDLLNQSYPVIGKERCEEEVGSLDAEYYGEEHLDTALGHTCQLHV